MYMKALSFKGSEVRILATESEDWDSLVEGDRFLRIFTSSSACLKVAADSILVWEATADFASRLREDVGLSCSVPNR